MILEVLKQAADQTVLASAHSVAHRTLRFQCMMLEVLQQAADETVLTSAAALAAWLLVLL